MQKGNCNIGGDRKQGLVLSPVKERYYDFEDERGNRRQVQNASGCTKAYFSKFNLAR